MSLQYRVEVGFWNPQSSLGTVGWARVRGAVGGVIESGDFVSVHARDKHIIARIVGGIAGLETHSIRDAPAPQVLAGPGVGEIGGRKLDRAVGLFDDQAAAAARPQFDR